MRHNSSDARRFAALEEHFDVTAECLDLAGVVFLEDFYDVDELDVSRCSRLEMLVLGVAFDGGAIFDGAPSGTPAEIEALYVRAIANMSKALARIEIGELQLVGGYQNSSIEPVSGTIALMRAPIASS